MSPRQEGTILIWLAIIAANVVISPFLKIIALIMMILGCFMSVIGAIEEMKDD